MYSYIKTSLLLVCLITLSGLQAQNTDRKEPRTRQIGPDIQLIKLTEHTYIHRSFKNDETYGRFASNGLVYVQDSMCIIFDTPISLQTTTYLLDDLKKRLGLHVQAVVVNHFHDDCIAGLDTVHARGITSYGNKKTIKLCKEAGLSVPLKKFGKKKVFKIGSSSAEVYYPGPGHSVDNTVAYVASEKILFGGCLLKAYAATKGNIADADLEKWAESAAKVKKRYPQAETLIPGHGHYGGQELLDYTIELFSVEQ